MMTRTSTDITACAPTVGSPTHPTLRPAPRHAANSSPSHAAEATSRLAAEATPRHAADSSPGNPGLHPSLEGVITLDPNRGQVIAVVGGDGSGKTTLLRSATTPRGRAALGLGSIPKKQVGYQGASSGTWANQTVMENLMFVARSYGIPAHEAQARAASLCAAAELLDATSRLARHLSGGMRQKLGVIMAMIHRPRLLVLDEPTTGVDADSRATLWGLIRQAADEGSTVLVSTTYLDEAESADRILFLDQGRLLAHGPLRTILEATPGTVWHLTNPTPGCLDNETVWQRGNDAYAWQAPGAAPPPSGGNSLNVADLDLELSTIATMMATHSQTRPFTAPGVSYAHGVPLIDTAHVSHSFGTTHVLDDVSLRVASGEIVGLIGGNGAGKSTLIRIILGLLHSQHGTIHLFSDPNLHAHEHDIGYVPQTMGLYDTLTPAENYAFTTRAYAVAAPPIHGYDDVPVQRLSLGARRRLAVDCALSHAPQLLILDEPTSGMDPLSRAHLWKHLHRLAQAGVGILVTTHYSHEANQCHRVIHLTNGHVTTTT